LSEGIITSSRIRFRKLSGEREDEGYKKYINVVEDSSIRKRISIFHLLEEIEISYF